MLKVNLIKIHLIKQKKWTNCIICSYANLPYRPKFNPNILLWACKKIHEFPKCNKICNKYQITALLFSNWLIYKNYFVSFYENQSLFPSFCITQRSLRFLTASQISKSSWPHFPLTQRQKLQERIHPDFVVHYLVGCR